MGEKAAVRYRRTRGWSLTVAPCLFVAITAFAAGQEPDETPEVPDTQGTPTEEASPEPVEPTPPGELKAVQGVVSMSSRSYLTFPSAPDQPHNLDATYAFPDRARWRIAPASPKDEARVGVQQRSTADSRRKARRMRYRWGTGLWSIDPGQQTSRRFDGEELRLALLQVEMRRVAMIWPAELEWTGESEERQASLPGVGILHVRLDPETGRPRELESRDPDGTPRERFGKIVWRAEGESYWPQSWDLIVGDSVIWNETFIRMTTDRKVLDSFFLPGDQRKDRVSKVISKDEIDRIKVPKFRAWRLRLAKEVQENWDEVIEIGKVELKNWNAAFEGMDYVLDDRLHFYVDEECRPFMLEIRMVGNVNRYPPEWLLQGGYDAFRSIHPGVEELTRIHLRRLISKVPKVEGSGAPYVAIQMTESGPGITQLVMPVHSH
jgi:hypothetical protein